MQHVSRPAWLVLGALLLLAVNLRPTAAAPGPVLITLRADLGLSASVAGLLTSLPVVCFAVFGGAAPALANRWGPHRVVVGGLGALVVGQVVRLLATDSVTFLVASVLALAGMALCNVLLPSLVKLHFPQHLGLVTACYSTALTGGLMLAAMLTAPLAQQLGGWRHAFWAWVLLAVAALGPWLALLAYDRGHRPSLGAARISLGRVARTPLAWFMAVFFGFQSGGAYTVAGWLASVYAEAGYSQGVSGLYLGIATGVAVPLGFVLPAYIARRPSPYAVIIALSLCGVAGYGGLLLAPRAAPGLWATLIAFGTSHFPIFLAFMGLRAHTSEGTAALSAFAQSVGYLLAIPWPLLAGVLRGATGSFDATLVMLIAMLVPLTVMGLLAARPMFLEDALPER